MNKYNLVVAQAWIDYDKNIVEIIEPNISKMCFTIEQKNILSENEIDALKDKDIEESIYFLNALNSINYQYWDIQDHSFIRYQNKGKIGALAAFEGFVLLYEHLKINNFDTSIINDGLMNQFFGDIPDVLNRINIFKESFDKNKSRQVYNIISKHIENESINVNLAYKISKIMPLSFNDSYLKKIQLSLYEIGQMYRSKGFDIKCDITVAADYQIPKVLEAMGILKYNEDLKIKIENFQLIEENSKEEKALRAATIIACEIISDKFQISIPALDRELWLARNNFRDKKFHLTKTSKY